MPLIYRKYSKRLLVVKGVLIMDIYIKADKKYNTNKTGKVHLKDIAKVLADSNIKSQLEDLTVLNIKEETEKCYLISIIDIINIINNAFPGHSVNSVGEIDTVVEFQKNKKENNYIKYIKIIFVCIVLFAGSATAIMSFHSDSQMSTVFENYYYIFFNEKIENPAVVNLPYSIGLAIGIIVFFNHFTNRKLTNDPTPIEVEMTVYEKDVTDNIIDTLDKESKNNGS